jgi:hypothetical protein
MRRLIYLLLLVIFVSISATCVNASTDCERWLVAYRQELAHSRNLQRIAAAKRRAKLKLAHVEPKPKPKVILAKNPRMTRKQTLHHFNLACGVLPEEDADGPLIAEESPVPFPFAHPLNDGIDLMPTDLDDTIAENDVPPPPFEEGTSGYPGSSGPPVYVPPFTGGLTPFGGTPGTGTTVPPNTPGTPTTPTTPVTPDVPEPASYVLMLTGMVGAAGAFRRRLKA